MRSLPIAAFAALLVSRAPLAAAAVPLAASEAGLDEHLGRAIRTDLPFTDMRGERVRLADSFDGSRPVLLVLAYYRCPMLCGLVLRGVVAGLDKLSWQLGEQYRALTVSFDPRDTPEAAWRKRESTLSALSPSRVASGTEADAWPFLVGREPEIRALADDLGFGFAYEAQTDQYAHPAAAFVLTPEGRISRVLYGIEFSARDLRLSLLEASRGQTGTVVDRVLMTCYRYDPASRRYGPFVAGFLRLGAAAILATVTTLLAVLWWHEKRRRREEVAR